MNCGRFALRARGCVVRVEAVKEGRLFSAFFLLNFLLIVFILFSDILHQMPQTIENTIFL